jgi:hypothetical protein
LDRSLLLFKEGLSMPNIGVSFFPIWLMRVVEGCCASGVTIKVKFTLEQAIKAQRGSRGMDLLFL